MFWEFIVTVPARGVTGYGYTAATTSDSMPSSLPYNVFFVDADDATSTAFFTSPPDSGYSVDNLSPDTPAPFTGLHAAGATVLHWGANPERDLAGYRLYRGSSADFVPGPGNRIAAQPDTGYSDPGPAGSYYKLSAVDVHGNESGFAPLTPAMTLGAPIGTGARVAWLAPVAPNPVRVGATFRFAPPRETAISLALYDAGGRRVRWLARGSFGGGEHAVAWDGEDQEGRLLPSGLYIVRLEIEGRALTTRMVAMR